MIIAHLADLHLGYRAYYRAAPGGVNLRERDVTRAFAAAIDRVIQLEPELVLLAGDVFHSVRPPNGAIADAFRQLARLRAALPATPVVVISGNHDAARSVESGSILRLLGEIPDVAVVEGEARPVYLDSLDTSVLCVPHSAARAGGVSFEPDPRAGTNVLLLHCTVAGAAAGRLRFLGLHGAAEVSLDELGPERWDYVALGHYHIATALAPNVWYAGATERTSPNLWEEAEGEKGFLTYDTVAGRATFHPVPTRAVVDLPRLSAREATRSATGNANGAAKANGKAKANGTGDAAAAMQPEHVEAGELDARIAALVEGIAGGLDGKIVRLVVEDVPRELFRELDHRRIREYKAQAVHFHLDVRRPPAATLAGGPEQRGRTLEEELETFLRGGWSLSTAAVERERLVALGLRYLREAGVPSGDEETAP